MKRGFLQYDLVFEGGGAKGAVFVGAIQEFERRKHTSRRFVGTSVGAITATLMAAGYTATDMLAVTKERMASGKHRFSTFMDIAEAFQQQDSEKSLMQEIFNRVELPLPGWIEQRVDSALLAQLMKMSVYRELFSFVERGGLYAGAAFLAWLHEKLNAGNRNLANATFAEFNQKTGADLSLVASDTTGQQMLVLNHRTAPQCPVAWGVRMSMSIPFIWQEVRWDSAWGTYQGEALGGHSIIVDGGVLSNFPLRLLTSRDSDVVAIMGNTDPDGAPNLGLLIDETLPVPNAGQPATPQADDSASSHPSASSPIVDTLTSKRPPLLSLIFRGSNRFPQNGGYVLKPHVIYEISVTGTDAEGVKLEALQEQAYVFAPRAVVDFSASL